MKSGNSSLQSPAMPDTELGSSLASLTRPPPGFSQPVKLGTSVQSLQVSSSKLLIPTLGGSSSAAPSGFGLGGLSLQGLAGGSGSDQPSGGLSLSSLASSHLASTGVPSRLSSPSLGLLSRPNTAAPSLSNLASSHLGSSASQGSTFTIPSIFGKKKEESGSVSTAVKSSDQPEINLMSALKLNSDLEITQKKAEAKSLKVDENVLNINILVAHNSFDSIKSILRKRTKTPFSFTITRYVNVMATIFVIKNI